MTDAVSLDITGMEGVLKTLLKMPQATRKKAVVPGLRKGAGIIKKQAEENVKAIVSDKATGFLSKSIVVRLMRAQSKNDFRVGVAIRGKVVNPVTGVRPGLSGSVLEHGKENQPPRPWLRPAASSKSQAATDAFAQVVQQKLAEVVEDAKK